MLKNALGFLAAASLATAPAMAQSSASALSLGNAVSRAGPSAADSELEGGAAIPMIAFAAIVVGGILLATGVIFDDDDGPDSP